MKIAIIHYWLYNMRGGEKVLEHICKLYPEADIFTHIVRRDHISEAIRSHNIETTSIANWPFAERYYQKLVGFMPKALEAIDLSGYDLVISSEAGPAKGVIPPPTARHLCYCHSPMRYIWDHFHKYRASLPALARPVFDQVAHNLRQWDVTTAARVDAFVANSSFVRDRIRRYYRRDAQVIHPPVEVGRFRPAPSHRGYYLFAGELVSYKRADLAVEAFAGLDRKLVIVGDGPERKRLQRQAGRNVTFRGRVPDAEWADVFAGCRALIFPGEEDFGIVPVEAQAAGRPVIAFGSGGIVDTVRHGETGLLFHDQSAEALRAAIQAFEARESAFKPMRIAEQAVAFRPEEFRRKFASAVDTLMGGPAATVSSSGPAPMFQGAASG